MNIRATLLIDIETDFEDTEATEETVKYVVEEDLLDLGYEVHSIQVIEGCTR